MAIYKLNKTKIRKAIVTVNKEKKSKRISDGGGLYLWLSSSSIGTGTWRISSFNILKQKREWTSVGFYDIADEAGAYSVTLERARELLDEYKRKQVEDFEHAFEFVTRYTFMDALEDFLSTSIIRESSKQSYRNLFNGIGKPLTTLPIDCRNVEIWLAIKDSVHMYKSGYIKGLNSAINTLRRYAEKREIISKAQPLDLSIYTPLVNDLKHNKHITHEQLPKFMEALKNLNNYEGHKLFLLLCIVTACRLSESLGFEQSERTTDENGNRLWVIPASRMKNGQPHAIPETKLITLILDKLKDFKAPHSSNCCSILTLQLLYDSL